jgi:hypothetical protein
VTFRPFSEAREYIRTLGFKSQEEWRRWCKDGNRPDDIPYHPDRTYKNEWRGMGDWLGTGRIADQDKVFRSFEQARKYIHSLGLKNQSEWNTYCKSGKKPQDIPSTPTRIYDKEWKGWGDWLGTGTVAPFNRVFRPFKEAREFV